MKKLTALFLALLMTLGCMSFASAELPPMTDEEITLLFGTWDTGDADYMAVLERSIADFEAAYPNITVEILPMSTDTLYSDLLNMSASGTMPDLYLTTEVPRTVQNGWVADISEYLDEDPDARAIMSGFRDAARIDGRDFAIPAANYPYVVIVNATSIENYNLELPAADWTWDEYVELAEALAHYENYNMGAGGHQPYRWYLALMEGQSSYGWDGEQYNFSDAWIEAIELEAEWREIHAWEGWESEEDKINALGSTSVWIGGTGLVGMFTDYSWGVKPFLTFYNRKTGNDFLIYPQPMGETDNAMAAVDYCVVSPSCEYPREAYELSKWIIWGENAAMNNVEYAGEKNIAYISRLPVITTQSVWDAYAEHHSDKVLIYDSQRNYIPEAHYVAPGYQDLVTWLNDNGVIGGISSGVMDGYAMLDELNDVAAELVKEFYANLILD